MKPKQLINVFKTFARALANQEAKVPLGHWIAFLALIAFLSL